MIRLIDLLKEVKNIDFLSNQEFQLLSNYLKGSLNKKDKTELIQLVKRLQDIKSKYPELQPKPFNESYRVDLLPINDIPVPLETLDVEYGGEKYGSLFGGNSKFQMAKLDEIPFKSKSELTGWTVDRDFAFEMLYDTARDNDFNKTVPILYEMPFNKSEFIFNVDFLEKIRGDISGFGYEGEVLRLGANKNLKGYIAYTLDILPDIEY
jgi:hypothetical protein